jgi:hypothetical protein
MNRPLRIEVAASILGIKEKELRMWIEYGYLVELKEGFVGRQDVFQVWEKLVLSAKSRTMWMALNGITRDHKGRFIQSVDPSE